LTIFDLPRDFAFPVKYSHVFVTVRMEPHFWIRTAQPRRIDARFQFEHPWAPILACLVDGVDILDMLISVLWYIHFPRIARDILMLYICPVTPARPARNQLSSTSLEGYLRSISGLHPREIGGWLVYARVGTDGASFRGPGVGSGRFLSHGGCD
jgi:hypothetical protein